MKNVVFWDVTPCGSCKNRRSGRTSGLHHVLVTANVVPSSLPLVTFLRNVGSFKNHAAQHHRRRHSSGIAFVKRKSKEAGIRFSPCIRNSSGIGS
jgi:hypothetical protein